MKGNAMTADSLGLGRPELSGAGSALKLLAVTLRSHGVLEHRNFFHEHGAAMLCDHCLLKSFQMGASWAVGAVLMLSHTCCGGSCMRSTTT